MGIDVDPNLVVTINASHNHRVFTGFHANPVSAKTRPSKVVVLSIFRRTKQGDPTRDGNPLIYALKRTRGYSIPYSSVRTLHAPFTAILSSVLKPLQPETIVPIPSSSAINAIMVKRIVRSWQSATVCDCLEKLGIRDVLSRAPPPSSVPQRDHGDYTTVLRRLQKSPTPTKSFEIKEIPAALRGYFQPLGFKTGAWGNSINGKRVVLVEDIISTGTTLECANRLLNGRYRPASVTVITLLSGV